MKKTRAKTRRSFKKALEPQTGPWLIEVSYKSRRYDSAGSALARSLKDLDSKTALKPRASHLYRLEGPLTRKDAERAARELLEDPVIQTSEVKPLDKVKDGRTPAGAVDVWLKAGVTDVVAETVGQGLGDFAIEGARARAGSRYAFPGLRDAGALKTIAKNFLVNPLIHEYHIGS